MTHCVLQHDLFVFWECSRCLYRFLTFREWTQHFIDDHISYFNEYHLDNKCDFCGKKFRWYHLLIMHYTGEHTRRLFMCSNCDEVFEESEGAVERLCEPQTPCGRCFERDCWCVPSNTPNTTDDESIDSYRDVLDVLVN